MDGLWEMVAAPIPVEIAGVTYRLAQLTLNDRGELEKMMMTKHPSPLDICQTKIGQFLGRDREKLLELAFDAELWGRRPTIAQFERWLLTYEGAVSKFWVQLRANHPEFTLEKSEQLLRVGGLDALLKSKQAEGMPAGNSASRTEGPAENPNESPSSGEPSSAA